MGLAFQEKVRAAAQKGLTAEAGISYNPRPPDGTSFAGVAQW
jgi:hypothetical protein